MYIVCFNSTLICCILFSRCRHDVARDESSRKKLCVPQGHGELWSVFMVFNVPYVPVQHAESFSWNRHYFEVIVIVGSPASYMDQ